MTDPSPRLATPTDVPAVRALIHEAGSWLRDRGIDQWQDPLPEDVLTRAADEHELYVLDDDRGDVVATVSLAWSDDEIWGQTGDDAGYVHRLAVARRAAGAGVGGSLLTWAAGRVRAEGRALLRLDCAATNAGLRSFYERQGFAHQGDVTVRSADGSRDLLSSLYQRPVEEDGRPVR